VLNKLAATVNAKDTTGAISGWWMELDRDKMQQLAQILAIPAGNGQK